MTPTSFTFDVKNGQNFNWWLQDTNSQLPIIGATLTASLYYGRSRQNPDATPGTVDPNFAGISLPQFAASVVPPWGIGTAAQYQGLILAAFDPGANPSPTPYGGGYTVVIDGTAPGYQPMHWEVPAVVKPRSS